MRKIKRLPINLFKLNEKWKIFYGNLNIIEFRTSFIYSLKQLGGTNQFILV